MSITRCPHCDIALTEREALATNCPVCTKPLRGNPMVPWIAGGVVLVILAASAAWMFWLAGQWQGVTKDDPNKVVKNDKTVIRGPERRDLPIENKGSPLDQTDTTNNGPERIGLPIEEKSSPTDNPDKSVPPEKKPVSAEQLGPPYLEFEYLPPPLEESPPERLPAPKEDPIQEKNKGK